MDCKLDDKVGTTEVECVEASVTRKDANKCSNLVGGAKCAFTVDRTSPGGEDTRKVTYDLSKLCREDGYQWRDEKLNVRFSLNICGYATEQCYPADCQDDLVENRNWEGGPCSPWNATANVGSVVRFFQTDLDDPPTTGTADPGPAKQPACKTVNNDDVQCTKACSVPAATQMNEKGLGVKAYFVEDTADKLGLVVSMTPSIESLNRFNPEGVEQPGGPSCPEFSDEFPAGTESVSFKFVCDPDLEDEAEVETITSDKCAYQIIMKTAAVCDRAEDCLKGEGLCLKGFNSGFCSASCVEQHWTDDPKDLGIIVGGSVLGLIVLYCLLGCLRNKCAQGKWRAPHLRLWVGCLSGRCCGDEGDTDVGINSSHSYENF